MSEAESLTQDTIPVPAKPAEVKKTAKKKAKTPVKANNPKAKPKKAPKPKVVNSKKKKVAKKPAMKSSKKVAKKAPKPAKKSGRGIRADGKPRALPGTKKPIDAKATAFGLRIRRARVALGYTQSTAANRAGVKQGFLSNVENGVSRATKETAAKICKAVGLKAA